MFSPGCTELMIPPPDLRMQCYQLSLGTPPHHFLSSAGHCAQSAIRYKYFLPLFTYFPLWSRSQCADKSVNFDNSARKLIPLSSKFLFFDLNFSVDLQARLRRIPGIFTKLLCADTQIVDNLFVKIQFERNLNFN